VQVTAKEPSQEAPGRKSQRPKAPERSTKLPFWYLVLQFLSKPAAWFGLFGLFGLIDLVIWFWICSLGLCVR
jgi:hypothetical protein